MMIRPMQTIFDGYFALTKACLLPARILVLLTTGLVLTACNEMTRPVEVLPPHATVTPSGPLASVVAAGLLRGDGSSIGPVVNGLKISRVDTGELVLAFNGYRMPTANFQYVVKVLPINSSARASLMSVFFIEYLPDGMRFNVRRGNANISVDDLKTAQFMFEVSLIE